MSYVAKQIAAAQKSIGDAIAGKGLRTAIRALQEKSKIQNSLQPLPARGAIVGKRKIGRRTSATDDSGLVSPFTETGTVEETTRVYFETVQELRSTDDLFVIQFFNVKELNFKDANGADAQFVYLDIPPAE